MKKIIAVNGSPRTGWNTDILVREAAAGAASAGAQVEVINLYDLEKIILTGDVAGSPLALTTRLNHNLQQRVLSRTSLLPIPVTDSRSTAPVRTGAMAVLRDMFQD